MLAGGDLRNILAAEIYLASIALEGDEPDAIYTLLRLLHWPPRDIGIEIASSPFDFGELIVAVR